MNEELLIKYSLNLGLALIFLGIFFVSRVQLHRKQLSLAKKISWHAIAALALSVFIVVLTQLLQRILQEYHLQQHQNLTDALNWLQYGLIALVIIHQVFLLINLLEKRQISKGNDPTSARIMSRVLKIGIFFVTLLLVGEHFGLSLSGLMAFGGVGGIAIGLASKDVLSNFFSGAMLFYDRQFNIGDWISSPDRQIEGTVEEIGWRITKIRTFDQRPLYVPNSLFSSISVQNPGRMTHRRINTTIGLRYEDAAKVNAIVQAIRDMLQQDENIAQDQTTLVYFDEFADSSLNIMVYCFTKTTVWAEWLEAQQQVYLKIIDIVYAHGADFAYPTQTLYVNAQNTAVGPASEQK